MNLRVRHSLRYAYDEAVVLDPHVLYLYPKSYPHQRLLAYALTIDPPPSKVVRNVDEEGNVQQVAYFAGPTRWLNVEAAMTVRSEPFNLFDFVLFPFEAKSLPFPYAKRTEKYLRPYLTQRETTPAVGRFAREVAQEAGWETVAFLTGLSRHIHETFAYERRVEGRAHLPDDTLRWRRGSCRDYAALFIAACRCLGIAARFVSGYLYGNPAQAHELHAWVEVYLPGAGWRGFDPTEGRVMGSSHISTGTSADHDRLAPVMGAFRGAASSALTAHVEIEEVGE